MSQAYDLYLEKHKANVTKAFMWIQEKLPEVLDGTDVDWEQQIIFGHDASKSSEEEYLAYDAYFYGGNRSYIVQNAFNHAWLHHIHVNGHHWQHWILNQDDPDPGEVILEMPHRFVVEMVCDWMSFGFEVGDLEELFKFYDGHKDYMKLGIHTRVYVDWLLNKIKEIVEKDGILYE